MTHVSRKKVDQKMMERILDFFVWTLTGIKDERNMRLFMDSFFTSTEKIMFTKRLGIVYLLKEKVPVEKICEVLSVTPATVQRMKLWLKLEEDGLGIAISVLKKAEKFDDFKKIMLELIAKLGKPPYRSFLSEPNVIRPR